MPCRPRVPSLTFVAILAAAQLSCGLVSFDVEQPIPPQTVQGSPLGALLPAGFFDLPITINLEAETSARGTGPASSANLKSLTLRITHPAGATFEFLDSIVIKVNAQNLAEREVARLDSVPATAEIWIPPVPKVDLLPYIKAGAILTATATGTMPSQSVTYDGRVVVTVRL